MFGIKKTVSISENFSSKVMLSQVTIWLRLFSLTLYRVYDPRNSTETIFPVNENFFLTFEMVNHSGRIIYSLFVSVSLRIFARPTKSATNLSFGSK